MGKAREGRVAAVSGVGPRLYGYARVSSREQNLDRQLKALVAFGVAPGDVLAGKGSDRLGRDYDEILAQWRWLTREAGCAVVVLDMPLLDTRGQAQGVTGRLIADIVLQLLSYVAQVERENIRQRQAEGIACAKVRGVGFGRPRKERPGVYGAAREKYVAGCLTKKGAAECCRVSVSTFDRWLREDAEKEAAGEG